MGEKVQGGRAKVQARNRNQRPHAAVEDDEGSSVEELAKYLGQEIAAGRGHYKVRVHVYPIDGQWGGNFVIDEAVVNDDIEVIDLYYKVE